MSDMLHILIPFYNASATLSRTLRSLTCIPPPDRQQLTIIGINDGSTDDSARLFEQEMAQHPDIPYRLLHKTNGGSASARNCGLETFKDGWVLMLDADDELAGNPIPALRQNRDNTALLFAADLYRNGTPVRHMRPVNSATQCFQILLTSKNPFCTSMVVFKRDLLVRMFDEQLRFLEDWHFWAVNPTLFADGAMFPETVLAKIHIGAGNKSADQFNNGKFRILAAEQIATYWGDTLPLIARNNLNIQREIGRIQMGERRRWSAMTAFPVSASLYSKLLIYSFLFPLYQRLNPYGARTPARR